MDTSRYLGRSAIVTGAASGIGRATVLRLAGEGGSVVACDTNGAALDETAEAVEAAGGTISTLVADVTDQGDVDRLVQMATAAGRIHLLANVAGIMDHFLPVTEVDDATFERVMAVNVRGPFRTCKAVLPHMVEAGGGAIVNIASIAGIIGSAAGATYTASKHAVVGLTRHISFFYGPQGIRCNAVAPGGVQTNIVTTSMPPENAAWAFERSQVAMTRAPGMAEPDSIATLVSWLGCDEASNVNGAILPADAGWTAS